MVVAYAIDALFLLFIWQCQIKFLSLYPQKLYIIYNSK